MIRDRTRLDDTVRELTANLQDLERYRASQEDEIRRLQTEVSDLQQSAQGQGPQLIQDLRGQITQQAAEIEDLDRRLTPTQDELATAIATRDRFDHQLDLAAAEISDFRSQITGQEHDLDMLNYELSTTRGSPDRIQAALQTAEAALAQRIPPSAATSRAGPTSSASAGTTPDVARLQANLRPIEGELRTTRTVRDASQARAIAFEGNSSRLAPPSIRLIKIVSPLAERTLIYVRSLCMLSFTVDPPSHYRCVTGSRLEDA